MWRTYNRLEQIKFSHIADSDIQNKIEFHTHVLLRLLFTDEALPDCWDHKDFTNNLANAMSRDKEFILACFSSLCLLCLLSHYISVMSLRLYWKCKRNKCHMHHTQHLLHKNILKSFICHISSNICSLQQQRSLNPKSIGVGFHFKCSAEMGTIFPPIFVH